MAPLTTALRCLSLGSALVHFAGSSRPQRPRPLEEVPQASFVFDGIDAVHPAGHGPAKHAPKEKEPEGGDQPFKANIEDSKHLSGAVKDLESQVTKSSKSANTVESDFKKYQAKIKDLQGSLDLFSAEQKKYNKAILDHFLKLEPDRMKAFHDAEKAAKEMKVGGGTAADALAAGHGAGGAKPSAVAKEIEEQHKEAELESEEKANEPKDQPENEHEHGKHPHPEAHVEEETRKEEADFKREEKANEPKDEPENENEHGKHPHPEAHLEKEKPEEKHEDLEKEKPEEKHEEAAEKAEKKEAKAEAHEGKKALAQTHASKEQLTHKVGHEVKSVKKTAPAQKHVPVREEDLPQPKMSFLELGASEEAMDQDDTGEYDEEEELEGKDMRESSDEEAGDEGYERFIDGAAPEEDGASDDDDVGVKDPKLQSGEGAEDPADASPEPEDPNPMLLSSGVRVAGEDAKTAEVTASGRAQAARPGIAK